MSGYERTVSLTTETETVAEAFDFVQAHLSEVGDLPTIEIRGRDLIGGNVFVVGMSGLIDVEVEES